MLHGKRARNKNHGDKEQWLRQFRLHPDAMLSRRKPSLIKLSNELRQIPDRDRTWAAKAFADAINGQTGGDDKGLVFYGVAFGVGASGQRPLFGVAQKPLTLAQLCAVGVDAARLILAAATDLRLKSTA